MPPSPATPVTAFQVSPGILFLTHSGGLSAAQRFAIKGAITAFVGATAAYVGKRYEGFSPALGEPQQSIPSYAYGDLRAGIQPAGL